MSFSGISLEISIATGFLDMYIGTAIGEVGTAIGEDCVWGEGGDGGDGGDIDHIVRLERGDVFVSDSGVFLGHVINWFQKIWSKDNEATYHHGGIITDENGGTFEALWKTRFGTLTTDHHGARVLIARPEVSAKKKHEALDTLIAQHLGQWYPWWRLGLHILGPLAKWGIVERLVCTELGAKYVWLLGIRHKQYRGTTPDAWADELKTWRCYTVIYEGTWPPEEPWRWEGTEGKGKKEADTEGQCGPDADF